MSRANDGKGRTEELRRQLQRRVKGLEERFNRHRMLIPVRNKDQKSTEGHASIGHSDNNLLSGDTSSGNRNGQEGNGKPAKNAAKGGKGAGAGSTV